VKAKHNGTSSKCKKNLKNKNNLQSKIVHSEDTFFTSEGEIKIFPNRISLRYFNGRRTEVLRKFYIEHCRKQENYPRQK
jgi:hypothetical protein